MLQIIFISTLIVSAFAQLTILEMPNYTPMANFDLSKFVGRWYEFARISNMYEPFHSCSVVDYRLLSNGTWDIQINSLSHLTGDVVHWSGQGDPINQQSSQLNIRFPQFAMQMKTTWSLLDTDYENFSVVLVIQNNNDASYLEYVWIMSKKPTLDEKYFTRAIDVLNANYIVTDQLEYIKQDNCPGRF
ncbi:hypothetical protein HCN44_000103 [Aphidius gifuensis]|uniref:Lipocalin/cytosolic fatty-acid binding domain-containing protein n=1 Tax=Aphidius gifuensis TaxID=684658 RepID=A0A834XN11_APHGI|nr:apolipoprotein D-like [Aphidius gifuensis]KAF7990298.1 hypothetical protein HCN44_000103 [Aphidius gifuensis]